MTFLRRTAVLGAILYTVSWGLATLVRPGSWRYNISDLYASGAPRPWLVMGGEAAFAVGLAALALGLRRALPRVDHRMVGCALLALASAGTMAGAVARNTCSESAPQCEGGAFATTSDWVHGIGGVVEILGSAGAALVLSAALPRHLALYSAATGSAIVVLVLVWQAAPYPWVGTAQRVLALALVIWVVVLATRLIDDDRAEHQLPTGTKRVALNTVHLRSPPPRAGAWTERERRRRHDPSIGPPAGHDKR